MALTPGFSVRVRVPASSANLGPGFDCLGMALALYDEWTVEAVDASHPPLRIFVRGADSVPTDTRNLGFRAFAKVFQACRRPLPKLRFHLNSRIPVAGGLGSSSAAIVGGLVAANTFLGRPLRPGDLLNLAAAFEGHPDNVAPALRGGFCAAVLEKGEVRCLWWNQPRLLGGMRAVVAIPSFELKTQKARRVLPRRVPRADAVFNVGRAALFVGALLSGRRGLLREAMEDRLHQPYRKSLIPGFDRVIAAAQSAGAHGAVLSGAGPTLLALAPASRSAAVGRAMGAAFRRAGVSSRQEILELDFHGARATRRRAPARPTA